MNIYEELRDLVLELEQAGMGDRAQSIEKLIAAGATGTEILMSVQHYLRTLDLGGVGSRLRLHRKQILESIDQALS